jgi:hypothetical protein
VVKESLLVVFFVSLNLKAAGGAEVAEAYFLAAISALSLAAFSNKSAFLFFLCSTFNPFLVAISALNAEALAINLDVKVSLNLGYSIDLISMNL